MIEALKNKIPDYAKDIKLNLSSVLTENEHVSAMQVAGIAVSVAYSIKNHFLSEMIVEFAKDVLDEAHRNAAKSAASIMAMNNVYYRFVHLSNDPEFHTMPPSLRMNVIANSGIDKINFELFCLAVSAINGCGLCMESHAKMLQKAGVSKMTIQHAIRIAAVLNAVGQVLAIEN